VRATRLRGSLGGSTGLLVVPAAVLVVHQLRYTLAYGTRANAELAAQGHSYLHSLVPWTVLALGVACSSFLRRAVTATRDGDARLAPPRAFGAIWLATTFALVLAYAVQEFLEGLLAAGHPQGMGGVFGNGGWWALPVAAAVALLVVALFRVARAVLELASRRRPRRLRLRPPAVVMPWSPVSFRLAPLASAAAGRAPPFRLG
jgi:hypothetical protein